MKLSVFLILVVVLFSCKERATVQSESKNDGASFQQVVEANFGEGDVEGTLRVFRNADSSRTKVVVEYNAGDYGNGRNEFVTLDGQLMFQRDSVVEWLMPQSPLDSNVYELRESTFYFSSDSSGVYTYRAVYSPSRDFDSRKMNELITKKIDSARLTRKDYKSHWKELQDALSKRPSAL